MMQLDIKLDGGPAYLEELDRIDASEISIVSVAALPGRMKPSGKPAVLLHLRGVFDVSGVPRDFYAITSLSLLVSACNAFCSRFGDPTRQVEPGAALRVGDVIAKGAPFTLGLEIEGTRLRGVFVRAANVGDHLLGFAPEALQVGDILVMDDAGKNWSVHR